MEKYAVIVSRDKWESAWIILSWWYGFETQVITVLVGLFIVSYTYLRSKEEEDCSEDKLWRDSALFTVLRNRNKERERRGAGKWESCNSHGSQWGNKGWWQMDAGSPFTTHAWLIFGIRFLLQFDLLSECVNSPAVEPASRTCMVHKAMGILCWIRHFIHCPTYKACKLSLQPSAILCQG